MFGFGNFLLRLRGEILREQPFYICDLETTQDDFNFVGKNGEFATMIRLSGIEAIIGENEFSEITPAVTELFKRMFEDGHHVLDITFTRDHTFTKKDLEYSSETARNTARTLDLDIEGLIDEDNDLQERYTVHENQYMVVWTLPQAISSTELKKVGKEKISFKNSLGFNYEDAQNALASVKPLLNFHNSSINSMLDELYRIGFDAQKIEVHDAVKIIRKQILPSSTSEDYSPKLPGDKLTPRIFETARSKDDLSELLYPKLGEQICPDDIEVDGRFCIVDGKYYANILVEQMPSNDGLTPFISLFSRIKPYIPWRCRYLISGKAIGWQETLKTQTAAFFAFMPENRKIIESIENIQRYEDHGGVAVKTRLAFTTWADSKEQLQTNLEEVIRAIQAWGNPQIIQEKGDPRDAFFSTIVGFTRKSVATGAPMPIEALSHILPIYRPATPWLQGGIKYRTIDGKPWSYQPNSNKQTVNITLVVGKPGNGKGVVANTLNIAKVLTPGIRRLPYISIIEMEPSSKGFIELIQNRLPDQRRHEAIYHRMNRNDGINPFDTNLGLSKPTTTDREFLIDFIVILTSPEATEKTPYTEMRELIGEAVDMTYTFYASPKNAKPYERGKSDKIDDIIQKHDLLSRYEYEPPSWRQVTDFLFKLGLTQLAILAQAFATPLLDDMLSVAQNSQALKQRYKNVKHNDEPYIDLMIRKISRIISDSPCFSKPTEVFLSSARLISLDLADVATTKHATAVFATFGAWLTSKHFYLKREKIEHIPPLYEEHYAKLLQQVKLDTKDLNVEEYHRYNDVPGVSRMVERFMAEGRKDSVNTTVISQLITAFTKEMRQMSTNQFLLVAGITSEELTEMKDLINLNETEMIAISSGAIHPPKSDGSGSSFLFRYVTKESGDWKSQVLVNTRPSTVLWELSTTTNDTSLRSIVTDKLGKDNGIKALVFRFPKGSADKYIEELKVQSTENKAVLNKKSGKEIIERVADEVIDQFYKKERATK